jgi:HK97 family phage prohead protease
MSNTRTNFVLDGKAMAATPLADGDLLLEGWAARWTVDRENEAFLPASFDRGVKAFLEGTAALCFQHRGFEVLGRVLTLERKPEGLWMKARVDGAIRTHPTLGTIYKQILNGTIRGLSVGGFFRRRLTPDGYRIADVDLTEVSATAVPVGGHGTRFSVVAGKALGDPVDADPLVDLDRRAAVAEARALCRQVRELRYMNAMDRAALL